jgi:predicted neutral ceramidase superfamily lipid hydrolase
MVLQNRETDMRPPSIVNFARVVLLSLALGILGTWLSWDKVEAIVAASGSGMTTGTLIAIQAVTIALYLLLIWFIYAKGSPVAKWIYVVLCVLGLVVSLLGFRQTMAYGTLPAVLAAIQLLLSIISLWLLFRPDSKAWFSEGRGDPNTVH